MNGGIIMESKFYKWNKKGSKMLINSKLKEFNKQTNYISSGNIIANTLYSNYIRPYSEIECNGLIFKPGHLFEYDLKFFNINNDLKNYLKELNKQHIILYEVFICKNEKRDIIGWLVEDEDDKKIINIQLNYSYKKNIEKRRSALKTVQLILEEKYNNENN